jgi:hypothetical protein
MKKLFYKFYSGVDNDYDVDDYYEEEYDDDDDDDDDYFNENDDDDEDDDDEDDDNDIIIPGNPMVDHKSPHPHINKKIGN